MFMGMITYNDHDIDKEEFIDAIATLKSYHINESVTSKTKFPLIYGIIFDLHHFCFKRTDSSCRNSISRVIVMLKSMMERFSVRLKMQTLNLQTLFVKCALLNSWSFNVHSNLRLGWFLI